MTLHEFVEDLRNGKVEVMAGGMSDDGLSLETTQIVLTPETPPRSLAFAAFEYGVFEPTTTDEEAAQLIEEALVKP